MRRFSTKTDMAITWTAVSCSFVVINPVPHLRMDMNIPMKNSQPSEMPVIPEVVKMIVRQMYHGLPLPDLVNYYVLENDRKFYLDSEVDNNVLNIQRMILSWNMDDAGKPTEERKPITLYIFSPGGDVDMMRSLINSIEASKTLVTTVNMGVAASAAGLIFLAGHKRYMLNCSHVVINEGSARMAGGAVKVMDAGESYKKMLKQMKEYILKRTYINASVLNKQKCHDWELDAKYCFEHGVRDVIVEKISEIL